jgi:hypothetical protein
MKETVKGNLTWTPKLVKLSHANFKASGLANQRNVIEIEVREGNKLLGTLRLGKGSARWNEKKIPLDKLASHLDSFENSN